MPLFRSLLSNDLAIDLGTANTLIYLKGHGVVCNEPSVVAVKNDQSTGKKQVVAVGIEAKNMLGRTPDSITAVKPLRNGVIADFEITGELLRTLMNKVSTRRFMKPRVIISVPHGVSEVERRAVRESVESAGAREVLLIEEPMAAAIGAGLPVTEACGCMVLNIGGGTSEIAVISLKGIVFSKTIRVGGDKMDEAIVQMVKRRHGVLIGERTAEQIKISIGSACPTGQNLSIEIRGRDLVVGAPKAAVITEEEVRDSLQDPFNQLVEMVRSTLEKTPPELSSDIMDRGLMLTGGGALLRNLDKLIAQESALQVTVSEDPLSAVVVGSGTVLDHLERLKDVVTH